MAYALSHQQRLQAELQPQPSHALHGAVPLAWAAGAGAGAATRAGEGEVRGGEHRWSDRWRKAEYHVPQPWEEAPPGVPHGGQAAHSWDPAAAVADAWAYAPERHHGSELGGPHLLQAVATRGSHRQAVTAPMPYAPHGVAASSAAASVHSRPSRQQQQQEREGLPWPTGAFGPSNTLLLDDSPYKAALNQVCRQERQCWQYP